MMRVGLLGEMTLEVDGTQLQLPASRRARSLLGLLALERRTHPRGQLAARFWPDVLDESARTSLRSALSALRRALGADADRYLLATRDAVALAGPDEVWTDLAEFQRLVAEGRLEDALELCRGDLLEDLDDDWVYERRDEHRARLATLLERMAGAADSARANLAAAIALTRRQAALDPLSEEAASRADPPPRRERGPLGGALHIPPPRRPIRLGARDRALAGHARAGRADPRGRHGGASARLAATRHAARASRPAIRRAARAGRPAATRRAARATSRRTGEREEDRHGDAAVHRPGRLDGDAPEARRRGGRASAARPLRPAARCGGDARRRGGEEPRRRADGGVRERRRRRRVRDHDPAGRPARPRGRRARVRGSHRPERRRADPRRGRLLRNAGRHRQAAVRRRRARADPRLGAGARARRHPRRVLLPRARAGGAEGGRRAGRRLRGAVGAVHRAARAAAGAAGGRGPRGVRRPLRRGGRAGGRVDGGV